MNLRRAASDAGLLVAARVACAALRETSGGPVWQPWQLETLAAIQTVLTSNDAQLNPAGAEARTLDMVSGFPDYHREKLGALLAIVEASTLTTHRRRFSRLDGESQETAIRGWSESRIPQRRAAFLGLKAVCMMGFWCCDETWGEIGYGINVGSK